MHITKVVSKGLYYADWPPYLKIYFKAMLDIYEEKILRKIISRLNQIARVIETVLMHWTDYQTYTLSRVLFVAQKLSLKICTW